MINKIKEAVSEMASKVSRDSKHIYVDNETGLRLQGVSTVSSIVPKDWLASWGAKEVVKALGYSDYDGDIVNARDILLQVKSINSPEEWIAFLKKVKGAHLKKSKQALIDGKVGHQWLENYIKAKIQNTDIPMKPDGFLERPLQQFQDWESDNVKEWVVSEGFVCDLERNYAGQFDAIYISKNEKLCLGDFKFASHLGEDYYLQTAGYTAPFEKYGIHFDQRVLIRLPKTLEREEWNEKEFKYEMKPNNIEVKVVQSSYEQDKKAFYAALIVKSWINMIVH